MDDQRNAAATCDRHMLERAPRSKTANQQTVPDTRRHGLSMRSGITYALSCRCTRLCSSCAGLLGHGKSLLEIDDTILEVSNG